jgi:hypothetical protein
MSQCSRYDADAGWGRRLATQRSPHLSQRVQRSGQRAHVVATAGAADEDEDVWRLPDHDQRRHRRRARTFPATFRQSRSTRVISDR